MHRDACSEASGREKGSYSSCQSWTRLKLRAGGPGTRRPLDRKALGSPMAIAATAKGAPGHEPTLAPTPRRQVGAIVTFAFGVLVNRQVGFRERFVATVRIGKCPRALVSARTGGLGVSTCRRFVYLEGQHCSRPAPPPCGEGLARTDSAPTPLSARPPSRRALLARLAIRSAGASAPALALLGAMTPNEAPGVAQPAAVGQHFRNPIG
jgi:hypothetical protein